MERVLASEPVTECSKSSGSEHVTTQSDSVEGTAQEDFKHPAGGDGGNSFSVDRNPELPAELLEKGQDLCVDHNPELPAELLEKAQDLKAVDNIGDTVFSKHWLFTTLMRLIEVVEGEGDGKDGVQTEAGVDLDDNLQDELCRLWDMSMNSEVVTFLQEFKAVDILTGAIAKSKAPRATEICVGILGNMSCNEEASKEMAANDQLIQLGLLLLSNPDAPTLVETTRLLLTAISSPENSQPWLAAIKSHDTVYTDVVFILASSTNNDLLRNTAMYVDKLLDVEEELCVSWAKVDFVSALMEATKQIGVHQCDALDALLHILQLVSTSEQGVQALVNYGGDLCDLLLKYLVHVCADDIVPVEGNENSLASALSTLNVILVSSDYHMTYIVKDFQLIRCLLKVLEVTYPKVHTDKAAQRRLVKPRHSRRKSMFQVLESNGSPDRHDEVENTSLTSNPDTETDKLTDGNKDDRVGDGTKPASNDRDSRQEAEYDRTRIRMLYDVLRGFIVDVVHLLKDLSDDHEVPKTLEYMDSMCPRERLYVLVWTLDDADHLSRHRASPAVSDSPSTSTTGHQVATLKEQSVLFKLERLRRIMNDARHI